MKTTLFIGSLFILLFGGFIYQITNYDIEITTKIFMLLPHIMGLGCTILVMKQRFDEIKGGEENDLSDY